MRWQIGKYSSRTKSLVIVVAALLSGVALGFLSDNYLVAAHVATCVSDFKFLNPNMDCDLSDKKTQNLGILEDRLKQEIALDEQNGQVAHVGVFVRDLSSTRFIGVNENSMFYMASLLKIPVLVGGYKLAEVEPRILDQQILYTGKPNLYDKQYIQPAKALESGKSYSVRELMRRAIVYSDNTAASLLYDYYPPEFVDRIVQALGIKFTRPEGIAENLVTPRTYAGIFRTLFYASYLTREYSNEALSILTQTTYTDGAVAKLPAGVLAAHKFAERSTPDPANAQKTIRQLHECGLVYANNGAEPYTFCIMTEGTDFLMLQKILQDLSLTIYSGMTGDAGHY